MDSKGQELGIMGPPPAMAHSSNSSRTDAPPLPASTPSPSNARTAAPPRRIIKTINLDFKKLKEAGLDRKLAEVLSKQSPGARAGITHLPSSSSTSSVAAQSTTTSATASATTATSAAAASSALHSEQQQFHQPALPPTAVKGIKISESMEKTVPIQTPPLTTTSSDQERSMHVKALLKNRILNKSMINSSQNQKQKSMPAPKAPPTAAQGSAPRSAGSSKSSPAASTSGSFSIPKADLTVRPKHPPLLLNLVNQLPKHRTMCVTTDDIQLRNQQELLQQKAFEKHPPPQQKPSHSQPQSTNIFTPKSSQDAPHVPIQNSLQNQAQSSHISMQKSPQKPLHIPIQNPPQAPLPAASANQLISPPPEVPIISQKSPSPPPLIVLENKVLAPNEKIDLSNLGLPSSTSIVTKSQPAAQAIIKGGRVIMNASKFKVPQQKLAEMAQQIRNQAQHVKLDIQQEEAVLSPQIDSSNASLERSITITTEVNPKQQPGFTQSTGEANELPILTRSELNESENSMSVTYASDKVNINTAEPLDQGMQSQETTESSFIDIPVNSAKPEAPKVVMSTETSFLDLPIHISTDSTPKKLDKSPDSEQEPLPAPEKAKNTSTSSKEIPELTMNVSSPVSKVQSAVDFIAQLTAENPLDESSFMDLSPEEQRLNALFGGAGGCSFTGVLPEKTESEKGLPEDGDSLTATETSSKKLPSVEEKLAEEEELPIGKIMKMDDMDILHATLDVSSDSTNILRISPNAIKLNSSVDKSIIELPAVTTAEVAIMKTGAESLVNATSIENHKSEQPSEPDMSSNPVTDSEPAKEVNPPAKRVPLRSKKAKINLVQRNKRPSIPNKPLEAKKTKLDDVEPSDAEATSTIIDHSLLEENRLSAGIEVPADEEQGAGKLRKGDEQQEVSQSKENKEQGSSESKDDKNAAKSSIERDLTQLYHPPKMPKTKTSKKNSKQEALEHSEQSAGASVSLIEILSQEQPPPQGDAKLPFRKETPAEINTPESTGIQNLMTHLTAEKVTPHTKKKVSSTPPGSEETTKGMPRKKRMKTRPVLSKRNSGKKQEEISPEFLHPVCESGAGGRIPTSSTSDDDGTVFLGFNNKDEKRSKTPVRSKRVRQMRINETDISDDATPDHDETEEEHQRPVNNDFRRIDHVSDSDSSECPTYFEDNPVNMDETLVSIETASSDQVKGKDVKGTRKVSILDETIKPEKGKEEALNEPEQPKTVINKKDLTIDDNKSRNSSKKSRKPSPKKDLDTKAIQNNSEKPSTSKGAPQTCKSKAKLQSKAGSQECLTAKESVKGSTGGKEKIAVSNENKKELKSAEELVTSVKSKGKRTSRSSIATPSKQAETYPKTETNSKQKEDEHKINERKTSTSSISEPVIDKRKEKQPIELANSENLKGIRASRHKPKSDSAAPTITELASTSVNPIEPIESRASRNSRSRTPKEPLPAQSITKSDGNHTDTTQEEPEEVKVAEEPSHSKNSARSERQSRSRKSIIVPPSVAKDGLKMDEEIKNRDSKNPQDVKAAENHSTNLKSKRQSRSKTVKVADLDVSKSQEEPVEKSNLASTCNENNVDVIKDDEKPSSSIKSKNKRQSRNTQKSVSNTVAANELEPTASLADSQPVETDVDGVVPRGTRRSSSRLDSVPPDTTDAPVSKDEDIPAPVPKREEKAALQSSHRPRCRWSFDIKKERKQAAPADTEPTGTSKKQKTELKQDPGVPQAFNKRLLLIRQREQLNTDEVLTDEGKGKGPLQCGLCLARSTEKGWKTHLAEHYGVGWLVGETPNVTRAWVLRIMKKYIDGKGEKLTCRLCQRQLGSHTGMLVHLESCGNKQRVECDLCKRSYAKLSLPLHRQTCTGQQKRKDETVSTFNLRLLLIRKREQLDSEEVLTEEGKGKGPLQCGLCLARTTKLKWQSHLEEHYGVGWLVGETPKNTTRNGIMLMMKAYLEEYKKKLVCRLCEHHLGSALGMMLHLETCGNKQRVECTICHRSYTILTLPAHFRVCSRRQQLAETSMAQAEQKMEEDSGEKVFSNAGRAKRKSTIKAETKLKNIGEHTSGKNEFDGSDSSDYDMANDKESSEEYDSEGVDSNEDSITAEQDGSDCDKSKRSRKRLVRSAQEMWANMQQPLFLRDETQKSSSTHKWQKFLQINYSESPLYCHLVPGYSTLSMEDAQGLLPSKETSSVRYAYGNASQDSDWQRLAPLEGFNKEGEYVGYLGGPVRQLAWVPLPTTTTDQYLLCSLRSRMKSFARHTKLKQEDGLLMLLKCTEGSSSDKTWSVRPELHYGIRIPNGPALSFAFLPSGGYDQATNRLGLLAVAHATSDVHIYALPLELKEEEKCGENVVIQLDAVMTLRLDMDQTSDEDQCTKICWSEAAGHNFLSTGYASGRIAFWDIGDTESINCFRRNNDPGYTFVPTNTQYLGERNIQFMELHYDINGIRWLAVGTSVRKFLVYDIMNWSQPTILMQSAWNNIYLATFTWSPISEAIVLSSTHYNSRAILLNPAGTEFESRTLDSTLTASRSMHSNCQQNYTVLVTDMGDLAFLDAKAITRGVYQTKTMINHRAVSTTKLRHLGTGKPNPNNVISADEFHRDYGVQIHPLVEAHPQSARNCPYLTEKRLPSNPHSLALTRNNCVRCNWNSSAHSWVAVGAEHGLLRILNFKRKNFF
ncbi:LOW QUALITY PROTEIN: nascent polypeptide-associated complex subunit alpha, muscle-specific form [Drosophila serrata]|uniref:LOW QUALITY PROTEIN: nascent polypeptide-associated complex subunit alpha, muscle-specific form n=1 Tax=Drosophila serrata TaxID=7274 RepID=UPI000A1D3257|nr:LOW QUALITY PROTEIN: nascent polypeptide-associated complex subunit alpha, muscle-specific form [Drosophila serrata]